MYRHILTSRNAGIMSSITNTQTKMMEHIDATFVKKLSRKVGLMIANALLNAISANAIHSTYENMKAKTMVTTHHPPPSRHLYPKYKPE